MVNAATFDDNSLDTTNPKLRNGVKITTSEKQLTFTATIFLNILICLSKQIDTFGA